MPGSPLTPHGDPDKEAVVTRDTLRSRRLNIEATFIAGGVPPACKSIRYVTSLYIEKIDVLIWNNWTPHLNIAVLTETKKYIVVM